MASCKVTSYSRKEATEIVFITPNAASKLDVGDLIEKSPEKQKNSNHPSDTIIAGSGISEIKSGIGLVTMPVLNLKM